MSEKIVPGPLQDCSASIQEAVCINTKKIFDSCRDQDCIEDLRFLPCPVRPGRHQQRCFR